MCTIGKTNDNVRRRLGWGSPRLLLDSSTEKQASAARSRLRQPSGCLHVSGHTTPLLQLLIAVGIWPHWFTTKLFFSIFSSYPLSLLLLLRTFSIGSSSVVCAQFLNAVEVLSFLACFPPILLISFIPAQLTCLSAAT